MAPRKGAGRKPAKNELASGLISALTFLSALKPATGLANQPYMEHVFLNAGWAIGFDGVLAMGHPIEDGVNGYVNTKLLAEALDNSDKTMTINKAENGSFHIESGKYMALVPAIDPANVPQTFPDAKVAPFQYPKAFIDATTAAGKVVKDTAEKALHASIYMNNNTVLATDGATAIEVFHGNYMPIGMVLPKVFATALAKTGKEPVGFGLANDFSTFTVWFADNSWLRTNCYAAADSWTPEVLAAVGGLFNTGIQMAELDPKLFAAVRAVIPFADDESRVIIRTGVVRTHPDHRMGGRLELASVNFDIDLNGKRLLAVEDMAAQAGVGDGPSGGRVFVFGGPMARGVIAGMSPLPEPAPLAAPAPAQGGWVPAATEYPPQAPATGGWVQPSPAQTVAPAPETPPQGWHGIPATGLAGDPEYEAARTGVEPVAQPAPAEDPMVADFDIGGWLQSTQGTDVGEQ